MPRVTEGKGSYKKRRTGWCIWCGEPFETNHRNATTDTPKCRSRLARFRKMTRFDPEEPVGDITAQHAFDNLVKQLLEEERNRRTLVRSVQEGGAAKMFEVAAQIAAKNMTPKRIG